MARRHEIVSALLARFRRRSQDLKLDEEMQFHRHGDASQHD
ncbi:MAG TPA: hypothetical protein VGM82_02070 [Gemmatimonadaceae bacterium]|jgi:hypothetical protein